MSKSQCTASCDDFGLGASLKPGYSVCVQVMGRERTSTGIASIQIPFREIHLVFDVEFLVILDNVLLLL